MASKTGLEWHNIDSVFLDMDGTLLDLHFDDHFWQEFLPQQYASHHQLTLEDALQQLEPRFKAKEGTLDWYCLDYWSRELQLDVPGLKTQVAHLIAIHDGVIDFLEFLRRHHKRVVLATNAHQKVLQLKMHHTGLIGHFDRIICSHDLGLPKENPQFWERLNEVEPFDKTRSVFVDDSLPVLRSAQQYGIEYLYCIAQPSSKKPPRNIEEFATLNNFVELIKA